MKSNILERSQQIFKGTIGYEECKNSGDLQEFLDNSYGIAGYLSRNEYYDRHNPMRVVHDINTPCLVINSMDGNNIIY